MPSDTEPDDSARFMFYAAYPVEAYREEPEQFWAWFQTERPGVSRAELEDVVAECEKDEIDQADAGHLAGGGQP